VKGALIGIYEQLTQYHRYHIRIYLKAGYSLSGIARRLGVHKATISREIRRNRSHKGYRPHQAHERALSRRFSAAKRIKMTTVMIQLIGYFIRQDFSPEIVAGSLPRKVVTF